MNRIYQACPILLLAAALCSGARAEGVPVIPGGVFVAGTTAVDGAGTPWAYVFISSPELQTIRGRHFAVHLKAAAPDAPGVFALQGVAAAHRETAVVAGFIGRSLKLGEPTGALDGTVRALFRAVKFPDYLSSLHVPREAGDPPHPDDPAQPGEPGTAEQLAAVVRRADTDDQVAATLAQLAAGSPAIAMASGQAWGGPLAGVAIGQEVTLEVRLFDPVACADLGVIGRVSFLAGLPQPLPAPGPPVEVPDPTSTGHLNIKLRWALPDELRRQSLLNLGFNLWRMPESFAVAHGYDVTPPSAAVLQQLASDPLPEVKRINTGTLFPAKAFSAGEVADFVADAETAFATDDNGRSLGTPFSDGQQLRYFVTARDLLGRDGLVSPGGLATACHRLPPPAPTGLRARCDHRFDPGTQTSSDPIVLTWTANAPDDPEFLTSRYEVIRGLASGDPLIGGDVNDGADLERYDPALLVPRASVPHGAPPPEFTDLTPCFSAAGNSCWYVVRAVFDGACGPVYSDPSPPVYACVRKSGAPLPPTICSADANVPLAAVAPDGAAIEPAPVGVSNIEFRVRASCRRLDPNVTWAEFRLVRGSEILAETVREHFPAEFADPDDRVDAVFVLRAASLPPDASVECRVGTNANAASAVASAPANFVAPPSQRLVSFLGCACSMSDLPASGPLRLQLVSPNPLITTFAGANANGFRVYDVAAIDGTPVVLQRLAGASWTDAGSAFVAAGKVAVPGGSEPIRALRLTASIPPANLCSHQRSKGDGSLAPVPLRVCLTPDTGEYRLYRRIDDGQLTLIAQGAGVYADAQVKEISHQDDALPASSGRATYFVQMVDRHGNASPLAQVGQCVNIIAPPPVPVLLEPQAMLDNGTPKVALAWFCPPVGIERFIVYIEPQQVGAPPPVGGGLTIRPITSLAASKHKVFDPHLQTRVTLFVSRQFLTGRVGSAAFQAGPDFTLAAGIAQGVTYKIWIKAVGLTGGEGAPSQQLDFTWRTPQIPPLPGVESAVPWPVRALVKATEFHPLVRAEELLALEFPWEGGDRYPVGVRIGSMPTRGRDDFIPPAGAGDPFTFYPWNAPARDRVDPHLYLHLGGTEMKRPLPAVLYRRQVANTAFPEASGDTVQVSPLVEAIGWELADLGEGAAALIHDRAFGVRYRDGAALDLFLLDSQPVVAGAAYHYYLVRFRSDGEIDSVVDAGEVTISEDF